MLQSYRTLDVLGLMLVNDGLEQVLTRSEMSTASLKMHVSSLKPLIGVTVIHDVRTCHPRGTAIEETIISIKTLKKYKNNMHGLS